MTDAMIEWLDYNIRHDNGKTQAAKMCLSIRAFIEAHTPKPNEDGLLPCPFCGAYPLFDVDETNGEVFVFCTNGDCHVMGGIRAPTKEEALTKWNTRKEDK